MRWWTVKDRDARVQRQFSSSVLTEDKQKLWMRSERVLISDDGVQLKFELPGEIELVSDWRERRKDRWEPGMMDDA